MTFFILAKTFLQWLQIQLRSFVQIWTGEIQHTDIGTRLFPFRAPNYPHLILLQYCKTIYCSQNTRLSHNYKNKYMHVTFFIPLEGIFQLKDKSKRKTGSLQIQKVDMTAVSLPTDHGSSLHVGNRGMKSI